MTKVERDTGRRLVQSLTMEQIEKLLDIILSEIDITRFLDKLTKSDEDMAKTLIKVTKKDSAEEKKARKEDIASDQKNLERWDRLWEKWDDRVSEVGDERGKYSVQEEHWEPPYFDGYTLAEDLDSIAEEMLPLIDKVFDLVNEPELYTGALDEIESGIREYPEWMGAEHDEGCTLNKNATRCVLKWFWHISSREAHPGEDFLHRVHKLFEKSGLAGLNEDECIDFFSSLPDEVCREIYESFAHMGGKSPRDAHSLWHSINHRYDERFDSSKYLRSCNDHLAENWSYGKPLIDNALAQGDYSKAESFLNETFISYLHPPQMKEWHPENSLLLTHGRHNICKDGKEIAELLELWSHVAEKLGNEVRSAASILQSVILRMPEEWDKIINTYRVLENARTHNAIASLFREWQTEMAWRNVHHEARKNIPDDTWIHWLIDALSDGEMERFNEKIENWLQHLEEDGEFFEKQWPLLARLTQDLPGSKKFRTQYPAFSAEIFSGESESSPSGKARCQALEKAGAGSFLKMILSLWQKHMPRIIPDPANAYKSNYLYYATWMKALYEISQDEYHRLVAKWREKHKKRKNLWQDMKSLNLPF